MFVCFQGKSLSLICGALTWLREHEERQRVMMQARIEALESEERDGGEGGLDWFTQHAMKNEGKLKKIQLTAQLKKMDERSEKLRRIKEKREQLKVSISTRYYHKIALLVRFISFS